MTNVFIDWYAVPCECGHSRIEHSPTTDDLSFRDGRCARCKCRRMRDDLPLDPIGAAVLAERRRCAGIAAAIVGRKPWWTPGTSREVIARCTAQEIYNRITGAVKAKRRRSRR